MSQEEKFVPSIEVLFELELADIESRPLAEAVLKDLLFGWGIMSSTEIKHLGYAKPKWGYKRTNDGIKIQITPDEFDLIDRAMSRLLSVSPGLFELLKWRYYFRTNVGAIAANLLRVSPRTAGRRLALARMAFYNSLAVEYGSDKRYALSPALINSAMIESSLKEK